MTGPWSLHHARILGDWTSDLTLLTNGHDPNGDDRADLAQRGVKVVDGVVLRLDHVDGHASLALLEGGTKVPTEVVYLNPQFAPASPIAALLGCAMTDTPLGPHVTTDAMGRTSIDRVFAAGDLTRPF